MDQQTLTLLLTIFVGVAVFMMIVQAVTLIGLLLVARQMRSKVQEFSEPIKKVLGTSQRTIGKIEEQVEKIGSSTGSIMETTKEQVSKISDLLNDASGRAKVQMDRAELVLDDTMTRVQTTASYIQSGVLRPVREVHGIFTGVRTALMHLSKPGSTVDHATSDEEMFI